MIESPLSQLNVSVSGLKLPAPLENESYSCHFEDSMGRFNITVPSVEVIPGTAYTCNITNQVPDYGGIQAGKKYVLYAYKFLA